MTRAITLLGPQRSPSVQNLARDLDPTAPIATVTAGWLERESDDAELDGLLGGRSTNLGLHARWLDVQDRDREYAHADRDHQAALGELRQHYLVQLDHALRSAYDIAQGKEGRDSLREAALADALDVVRQVDRQHLARIREAQHAFYAAWPPHERTVMAQHRDEVAHVLHQTQAAVLAGGHVDELTKLLHLFNVAPHLPDVLVAWSAGAMALGDRVVLFHDFVPHGVAQTEVFEEGLGVLQGLVPLPHMRRRLRVDDTLRMSVLARRFAPARCLALDDGARVALTAEGGVPAGAKVLTESGLVGESGSA